MAETKKKAAGKNAATIKTAAAEVKKTEAKAEATVKEAEKIEAVKEAEKAVEKKAAPAKKAATKKAETVEAEKEAPAKKAAAPKAEEVKANIVLQYADKDVPYEAIVQSSKDNYANEMGGDVNDIKKLSVYVKPEENAAYYVVNDKVQGRVEI
ncbi:MAG: DUF6465 family protein [Butyrivibrio sp.]|nr:DUF6465 family protein [Butyrivibrio sp.]